MAICTPRLRQQTALDATFAAVDDTPRDVLSGGISPSIALHISSGKRPPSFLLA
jgi:hypothetical protein